MQLGSHINVSADYVAKNRALSLLHIYFAQRGHSSRQSVDTLDRLREHSDGGSATPMIGPSRGYLAARRGSRA